MSTAVTTAVAVHCAGKIAFRFWPDQLKDLRGAPYLRDWRTANTEHRPSQPGSGQPRLSNGACQASLHSTTRAAVLTTLAPRNKKTT